MKKWIALLLTLACLLSLSACSQEKSTSEEETYVTVYLVAKEGTDITYAYDENGNQTDYIERDEDGKVVYRITCAYDENSNQTERVVYWFGQETRVTWSFDENSNPIEAVYYNAYGEEDERHTWSYDKYGSLIEEATYNKYGKERERYTYTYDKSGKLIEKTRYDVGEKRNYYTYTYDKKTNTSTEYKYSVDSYRGDYVTAITVTTYDDQNRVCQQATYSSDDKDRLNEAEPDEIYIYEDGKLVEYTKYTEYGDRELWSQKIGEYNEHGHLVRIYRYDRSSGSSPYERTFEYAYDENGNITNKKTYNNGELVGEITYSYTTVKVSFKQAIALKKQQNETFWQLDLPISV